MIASILVDTNVLVFAYDRSADHLFFYVRHIVTPTLPSGGQLLPALQAILHTPHQQFRRVIEPVPLYALRHVDGGSLVRTITQLGGLSPLIQQQSGKAPSYGCSRGIFPNWSTSLALNIRLIPPKIAL